MAYINSSINESPVINAVTALSVIDGAHKAVKFNSIGSIELAGENDIPAGILTGSTDTDLPPGSDASVQIRAVGYITAGDNVVTGDPVSVADGGVGVKSTAGKFILGFALSGGAKGELIQIQITKSGYYTE